MAGWRDKMYEKQRVIWKNLRDLRVKMGPVGSNLLALQVRNLKTETICPAGDDERGQE
jgi:hypothetical protein